MTALGRIVRHDPRSMAYRVKADGTAQTIRWARPAPSFDQGDLGSCTGNATAGVLDTAPFNATLGSLVIDEALAVKIYSLATQLDGFPGQYPPDDTGSSGLGAAQAAKKLGFISGYQHITSVGAAQTAIQSGPFITGVNWYEGFDNPDATGYVTISGSIRGGHEFEIIGYNAQVDLWEAVNSWGASWGFGGRFFFSSGTYASLLAQQGDATTFVPVNQPAPTPTVDWESAARAHVASTPLGWETKRHVGDNAKAAQSYKEFRAAVAL